MSLRASTAEGASTDVVLPWTVSALPSVDSATAPPDPSFGPRYSFSTGWTGTEYRIVRSDRSGGPDVVVQAFGAVPQSCRQSPSLRIDAATPDGAYVVVSCSGNGADGVWRVATADAGADAVMRVDVAEAGFVVAPLDSWVASNLKGAGISDDGRYVGFMTRSVLTQDIADRSSSTTSREYLVGAHLYVRDVTGGRTAGVPAPPHYSVLALRTALISGDGQYIDSIGRECDGFNGGFCGEGSVSIQRSPFARPASTFCPAYCSATSYWGFVHFSTSNMIHDGLRVAVVGQSHTSTVYRLAGGVVLDGRTGATRRFTQTDTERVGEVGHSILLSADGTRLFYTEPTGDFTCTATRYTLGADLSLGSAVTFGRAPGSLPNTGCSWATWTNADGTRVAFSSTATNLLARSPSYPDFNYGRLFSTSL